MTREEIAELVELILDRSDLDEHLTKELQQTATIHEAALRLFESQQFVRSHRVALAEAFGVRAAIEPYL